MLLCTCSKQGVLQAVPPVTVMAKGLPDEFVPRVLGVYDSNMYTMFTRWGCTYKCAVGGTTFIILHFTVISRCVRQSIHKYKLCKYLMFAVNI